MNLKQVLAATLSTALLLGAMPEACAAGIPVSSEVTEVSAKATILMERETGTVLCAENEHQQLEPASVTKVMTMLLTVEALDEGRIGEDDLVTASAYAASMGGSQIYLKEGEQMSVRDLLKSVAVASGNDAAVALAEYLAGSEQSFVEQMNQRAEELGMGDTNFCNCNGLPAEGHLTSAYDIALMSRELLSHDSIRDYVGIWMDSIRDGAFELANTNKLIYYYDGATGLKTGSTDSAGYCISASAQRDGMELIAVVLGSETSSARFESAKSLLNYGFGAYTLVDATPETALPVIPVSLGTETAVSTRLEGSCKLLVKKDETESITTAIEHEDAVAAPVKEGDRLGTLSVSVGGTLARQVPLTAAADVERLSFGGVLRRALEKMAMQP